MHGDELARATGVPKPGRRLQPSESLPTRERSVGSTINNVKGEQTGISLAGALWCGVEFRCARTRCSWPSIEIGSKRINVSQERYGSRKFAPLLWASSKGPMPLRLQDGCAQRLLLPRREHHGSLGCQQPEREGLLQVQFDDRLGMAQVTDRDVLPNV